MGDSRLINRQHPVSGSKVHGPSSTMRPGWKGHRTRRRSQTWQTRTAMIVRAKMGNQITNGDRRRVWMAIREVWIWKKYDHVLRVTAVSSFFSVHAFPKLRPRHCRRWTLIVVMFAGQRSPGHPQDEKPVEIILPGLGSLAWIQIMDFYHLGEDVVVDRSVRHERAGAWLDLCCLSFFLTIQLLIAAVRQRFSIFNPARKRQWTWHPFPPSPRKRWRTDIAWFSLRVVHNS